MISFKTYLFESTFTRMDGINGHFYHHQAHVDGKQINLSFTSSNGKTYVPQFDVNGSGNQSTKDLNNTKILHHIKQVTHLFINQHKPDALLFRGADADNAVRTKKNAAYGQFAHHLAKHFKGEYQGTPFGHLVKFR